MDNDEGNCKHYTTDELCIGMFVASLNKPMHQAPFPPEGLYIGSKEELTELQKYHCTAWVLLNKSQPVHCLELVPTLEEIDFPPTIEDPSGFLRILMAKPLTSLPEIASQAA